MMIMKVIVTLLMTIPMVYPVAFTTGAIFGGLKINDRYASPRGRFITILVCLSIFFVYGFCLVAIWN